MRAYRLFLNPAHYLMFGAARFTTIDTPFPYKYISYLVNYRYVLLCNLKGRGDAFIALKFVVYAGTVRHHRILQSFSNVTRIHNLVFIKRTRFHTAAI